jgi:hypothetical protein
MDTTISPTSSPRRNAGRALAGAVALAAATSVLTTTAPASAARSSKLTVVGTGSVAPTAAGGWSYEGQASGTPFGGAFSGHLEPADGTLPELGSCEPATATLRVDDGARFYRLESNGQVCSWFLPMGTMHQFTGRFTVAETSHRKLRRVEGVTDLRMYAGGSDIYAVG